MTNWVPMKGGAWDIPLRLGLRPAFTNKLTPEHKGLDGGFRTFRNCREKVQNG